MIFYLDTPAWSLDLHHHAFRLRGTTGISSMVRTEEWEEQVTVEVERIGKVKLLVEVDAEWQTDKELH